MADWPKDKYKPEKRYKTNIYLINDKQEEFTQAKVYLKVLNPEGKAVLEKEFTLNIEKDSLKRIDELRWTFPKDAKGIFTLQLKLDVPNQELVENSYPLKVSNRRGDWKIMIGGTFLSRFCWRGWKTPPIVPNDRRDILVPQYPAWQNFKKVVRCQKKEWSYGTAQAKNI